MSASTCHLQELMTRSEKVEGPSVRSTTPAAFGSELFTMVSGIDEGSWPTTLSANTSEPPAADGPQS